MRVKVAGTWFEVGAVEPIMVELSDADRRNIANMHCDATRYAEFAEDETMTVAAREAWMDEGASTP